MAPPEKTVTARETSTTSHSAQRFEGNNSGFGRGFSSPVLGGDDTHGTDAGRGRTCFGSSSGWVTSR